MVAPADPVPESLKTARAVSPFSYSKLMMRPCFDVWEPSTGSVYLFEVWEGCDRNEKGLVSKNVDSISRGKDFALSSYLARQEFNLLACTYPNSSAPVSLIPESSPGIAEQSPFTKLSLIKSIILLAASESTAS